MSLSENGGNGMVMPVSPMYGNGGGYGNGWFGDGSFWIIFFLIFAIMGNGWNGGYGNGNAPVQQVNNDLQRGFDQQAIMGGINNVNNAVSNGFANAEVSRCNNQANIMLALNNIASDFQQCCCENRAQTADLKYTVSTEAANTRNAVQSGNQMIMDKLCQLELDGVKQNYEAQIRGMQNQIDGLGNALNTANTRAFVTSEVARVLADNSSQTQALEQYLNPAPIPAYMVQNPNCCAPNYFNAGCGCNA